jgi:hypothetical protein
MIQPSKFNLRQSWLPTGVVIAVLGIVSAISAYWFAHEFPDEIEYWTLAKNLVHTGLLSFDGTTPSAYRPPLLAWILAPIVATGASLSIARICFVIFFCFSGVLSAAFLHRFLPKHPSVATLGTAFVLCSPLYFFSAGNLYPQQILVPLLLTALFCACSKPRSSSYAIARSLVIGACTGASLLASAPSLFSLLPVWLLLAIEDCNAIRASAFVKANRVVTAAAVLVILITPYLYRNYRNVHPGVYLSLNSGINLLLGNSPKTTPSSGVNVDLGDIQERLTGESEFDANRRLTKAAVENIKGHPGYYGVLYVRKLIAGFSSKVDTVTHGYNRKATWLVEIYMTFVWIGVALLLIRCLRRTRAHASSPLIDWSTLELLTWLVLAAYLLNLAGYAVFFNRLRFRLPVDVALALVSAAGWALTLLKEDSRGY